MSKSSKIYISGKITDTKDYIEKFNQAENELIDRGFVNIINPAFYNSHLPTCLRYDEYMKVCYTLLDLCDSIYMLRDWKESVGATAEYHYAKSMGKTIILQED